MSSSPTGRAANLFRAIATAGIALTVDRLDLSELLTDKSVFNKNGEIYSLTKENFLSAKGDINLPNNFKNAELLGNQHSTIIGNNINNILKGNNGNNVIYGNGGNDSLFGGLGNDRLFGDDGNDILEGGKGNDYLEGGNGNDTYKFNLNDGNDVIVDGHGHDTVLLGKGIKFENTLFSLEGNKIKLSFLDSNTSLSIDRTYKKSFAYRNRPNKDIKINFNNGKSLTYDQIKGIVDGKNKQVKNSIRYEHYDQIHIHSTPSQKNLYCKEATERIFYKEIMKIIVLKERMVMMFIIFQALLEKMLYMMLEGMIRFTLMNHFMEKISYLLKKIWTYVFLFQKAMKVS